MRFVAGIGRDRGLTPDPRSVTLGYRPMVRHKLAPACGIDAGERVAKVRRTKIVLQDSLRGSGCLGRGTRAQTAPICVTEGGARPCRR
jgi:hypothetical protein